MSDPKPKPYRPYLSPEGLRKLKEIAVWRRLPPGNVLEVLIDDGYDRMKASTAEVRL